MPQITGPQIWTSSIDTYRGELTAPTVESWERTLKTLIAHPTIKIARFLSVAPAVIRQWTTEATRDDVPAEIHDHVRKYIIAHQATLVSDALLGMIDWGWIAFERILDDEQRLSHFKHLLQVLTTIRVDPSNGDLIGIHQEPTQYKQEAVDLDEPDCIVFSQNVQGQEWYGRGDVIDAKAAHDMWFGANQVANRYDAKAAGAHWVIKYPMGTSEVNGEQKDNGEIARDVLDAIKSNGVIAIPMGLKRFLDASSGEADSQWSIELMESTSNTSVSLDTRLRYCDVLMVRAFCMPERTLQEGQHGTKAEAEAHGDVALTYVDMRLQRIIRKVNHRVVEPEITTHFGPQWADAVKIVPEPIDADQRAYLRSIYDKILSTPEGFMAELDAIDIGALRDMAGVPSDKMNDQS